MDRADKSPERLQLGMHSQTVIIASLLNLCLVCFFPQNIGNNSMSKKITSQENVLYKFLHVSNDTPPPNATAATVSTRENKFNESYRRF